jgi:glutaminase
MPSARIPLDAVSQEWLHECALEAKRQTDLGQLPTYIPALGTLTPDRFALAVSTVSGRELDVGDRSLSFPLMSVIKPFLVLYLLETVGTGAVFSHVGMQPSDQSYNSLMQLELDNGFPRNPMLNSGAIALCGQLAALHPNGCERFCDWLNTQAQTHLKLDQMVLDSVQSRPNDRNRTIAKHLSQADHLVSSAADALNVYEHVCCLAATVTDMVRLGMLLVSDAIAAPHRRAVLALMTTCGLYEYSAQFALEVGLPAKSGVSGAVLAIVPRQGAIACYSPPLDAVGNSIAGIWVLRQLSSIADLSLFG